MKRNENAVILIVDDRPANILALEGLLSNSDRTFITADSGEEAVKIAREQAIDLILLDVQMPGMNGFEVAQILQSQEKTRDIPIIFASAEKKEHASMMKGYEEGAIDYLFKPLDPAITRAKVAVLLKVQRQKKELMEKNAQLEIADQQIRELNKSLQKNIAQLEDANHELESFSYSVSHDLRAPLRALHGNVQVIEEDYGDELSDEAKTVIEKIRKNASRMDGLINDLLSFSRIGKKEVRKAPLNMEDLVREAFETTRQAQPHQAEIVIGALPDVQGDYSLLCQVWANLISNAIKYSSKEDDPRIEVGSRALDGEVEYFIRDNGVGFNMAYANKLFGTFQRLHDVTEFEGTGIGLAITKRIVLKHGGAIRAEAEAGKGATFYFTLPVG